MVSLDSLDSHQTAAQLKVAPAVHLGKHLVSLGIALSDPADIRSAGMRLGGSPSGDIQSGDIQSGGIRSAGIAIVLC